MRRYRTLLAAGIATAAMGLIWLVLSILSYGAPPQPTLIPVEENDTTNTTKSPSFPVLKRSEVIQEVNGAVSSSEYGIKVEFVRSDDGYLTGGIGPVNSQGEGQAVTPNALLLSATNTHVYHHRIILCGADSICIADGGGGGPIFASSNNENHTTIDDNSNGAETFEKDDSVFYQFYPLNDVTWKLGDIVHIWMLVSYAASDGSPSGNLNWADIGEVAIEKCDAESWCPTK